MRLANSIVPIVPAYECRNRLHLLVKQPMPWDPSPIVSLPEGEDHCSAMRRLPRWRQFPRLYRVLVTLFAAIDVVILRIAATAAGPRSWLHAAESLTLTVVFLLLLYPFFVPVPVESSSRQRRPSGITRIVSGLLVLFLSGWGLLGAALEFEQGIVPEYALEGIAFLGGLTAMGALLVWRGWQRRRGIAWATFPSFDMGPGPPTSLRTLSPAEKRSSIAAFIAFFILGSAVLFSFNFYDGAIAFQASGWLVTPIGFVTAAAILIANRRLMMKARICFGCGQHVPLGATLCPSCSRPFP